MSRRRDGRGFVFLATELPNHPKLMQIDSPLAGWLYVVGLCHAGEYMTDGHLRPKIVARQANVPAKWAAALVRAGLWHEAGHDCARCPQPASGEVFVHDYLAHQQSRDEAEQRRASNQRAAAARWHPTPDPGPQPDLHGLTDVPDDVPPPAQSNAPGMHSASTTHAQSSAEAEAEAKAPPTGVPKPLLKLVGRLALGDARVREACLPDLVAGWQDIAGPGVELEDEARGYLERYIGQPAHDELGAWLGWLRTGRRNRARGGLVAVPAPPPPPPPAAAPVRTPCAVHPDQPAARCDPCQAERKPFDEVPEYQAVRSRRSSGTPTREAAS